MRQEAALNLSELLEQEIGRRFMPDLTLERKVGIFDLYQAYGFYLRLLDEICDTYALDMSTRASEKQLKMISTLAPEKGTLENFLEFLKLHFQQTNRERPHQTTLHSIAWFIWVILRAIGIKATWPIATTGFFQFLVQWWVQIRNFSLICIKIEKFHK